VSRVTLVIPCYNEAQRLNVAAFESCRDVRFCFVNDGSIDGTARLLDSLAAADHARNTVIHLERNRGKAEAVRTGILHELGGTSDFIGFWDADLATPLTQLPKFVDVLETRAAVQMVLGARVRLLGREISRRPSRHYVGRMGATLISSSLGLAVYDTQCGAKLFRATPMLREIFADPFVSRWIFDVEIIARLVQRTGRAAAAGAIYELPLTEWHDVEGSKLRPKDYIRALTDLWKIHRAYNARR
jgi:dolichyl-phosphate beta-glucosyltransferase